MQMSIKNSHVPSFTFLARIGYYWIVLDAKLFLLSYEKFVVFPLKQLLYPLKTTAVIFFFNSSGVQLQITAPVVTR